MPNSVALDRNHSGEVNVPQRRPFWKRRGFWVMVGAIALLFVIESNLAWKERLPKSTDEEEMEHILGRKPYR